MTPGLVALYPNNLTNADTWSREADWLLDWTVGSVGMETTHMCSYMCWFAEGSVDHGSLCYMPQLGPSAPLGVDVCDVHAIGG